MVNYHLSITNCSLLIGNCLLSSSLFPMSQNHRRLPVKGIVHAPDGLGTHGRGAQYTSASKPVADMVHGLVKVQGFFGILKKVDLVIARDQMAESNADEADQHPFVVQRVEQFQNFWNKHMIGTRVRYARLFGIGVEIRIPNLNSDAGRQFITST